MRDLIAKAAADIKSAKSAGEDGALDCAVALIDQATARLDELWEQSGPAIDAAGPSASPDQSRLVGELTEAYGVRGGILRAAGKFEEAAAACDAGLRFEQHAARRTDNTYNLTGRLVNRAFVAPHLVGADSWEVLGVEMWPALEAARAEVWRQLSGSRAHDSWAPANLLVLDILAGAHQPEEAGRRLMEACSILKDTAPPPYVYVSVLRVLDGLAYRLEKLPASQRQDSWSPVTGLIDMATRRLAGEAPREWGTTLRPEGLRAMKRNRAVALARGYGWKVWGKMRAYEGGNYQCFRRLNEYIWIGNTYVERSTWGHAIDFVHDPEEEVRAILA